MPFGLRNAGQCFMDQVGASPLRSIVQHLREVLIRLEEQGISVSDPYSSNPDPAKNLNPDPDPGRP